MGGRLLFHSSSYKHHEAPAHCLQSWPALLSPRGNKTRCTKYPQVREDLNTTQVLCQMPIVHLWGENLESPGMIAWKCRFLGSIPDLDSQNSRGGALEYGQWKPFSSALIFENFSSKYLLFFFIVLAVVFQTGPTSEQNGAHPLSFSILAKLWLRPATLHARGLLRITEGVLPHFTIFQKEIASERW